MTKHSKRGAAALFLTALLLFALTLQPTAAPYRTGANRVSESYKAGPYYENLQKVPLTGDGRTDVLAVALSQVGYQEGSSVEQLGGTVGTSGNFTEYNYSMGDFSQGYGGKNYPWCASFVSFCLLQARCTDQNSISDWCRKHVGDKRYVWREVSCNQWASQLRKCGYFQDSSAFGGGYAPQSADLIFFTKDGASESHIGLVLYVKNGTVYTVEGNTSSAQGLESNGGGVYVKSYDLSDRCIRGYGVLPYKAEDNVPAIDYSGAVPTTGIYVATTNKYVYTTATATSHKWLLPKYSLVAVSEVAPNGRLRVVCRIGNSWVEGYVKNNTDRVVQLSSFGVKKAVTPLEFSNVYKSKDLNSYRLNGAALPQYHTVFTGGEGDLLVASGTLRLTKPATAVGYSFDGEETVWQSVGSAEVTLDLRVALPRYDRLLHTFTVVVKLEDGRVYAVDTLTFTLQPSPETEAPTREPTKEPTREPISEPTKEPTKEPKPDWTDAPADSEAETWENSDVALGGCGAVAPSAALMVTVFLGAALLNRKETRL